MLTHCRHATTLSVGRLKGCDGQQIVRAMEADVCISTHAPLAHVCSVATHPLRQVSVCTMVSASRCRANRSPSSLSLVNVPPRPVHHLWAAPSRSISQPLSTAPAFIAAGQPFWRKVMPVNRGCLSSLLLVFSIEANNTYYVTLASAKRDGLLNVL